MSINEDDLVIVGRGDTSYHTEYGAFKITTLDISTLEDLPTIPTYNIGDLVGEGSVKGQVIDYDVSGDAIVVVSKRYFGRYDDVDSIVATAESETLISGWRTPTKEEFDAYIIPNKDGLADIESSTSVWTSTEAYSGYYYAYVWANLAYYEMATNFMRDFYFITTIR